MCGDSKFVLLDEPTTGLDISARRHLWDVLRTRKKDKIIVFTTHYMEEAEILADRIGIMCKGKLTCAGSPMFLKSRFGGKLTLTLAAKDRAPLQPIAQFAKKYLGAQVVIRRGQSSELTLQVPNEYNERLARFFTVLESAKERL